METLVIGCGDLLRGDDGVGPIVVRRLAEAGLPRGVRCLDAGTGGIDAGFAMRGARRVIFVDACLSGAPPGTLHELGGDRFAAAPQPTGLDLHRCRWDQAWALARLLPGGEMPASVTVILVEGKAFDHGADPTPEVARGIDEACARIAAILRDDDRGGGDVSAPPSARRE